MKTYLSLLSLSLSSGLVVADCTTSTISLQTQSTTVADVPAATDRAEGLSLEITGCNTSSEFHGLTSIVRINLHENSFDELDLSGLQITDQIRVANNPNLTRLVLPNSRPGQTVSLPPTGTDAPQWTYVEILDNPQLDSDNIEYQDSANFWDWGAQNLSTFILSGGGFHSNFFNPISTSSGGYPEEGHAYVTTRFILNSTDSNFDCSYLNDLRYRGFFKGDYACQGRLVVPSPANSLSNSRDPFLGALAAAVFFVCFLV
ncbi:hypothetical protein GGR54DRAFT_405695 [Hypoxylon sp. NC1633]|nr:hypothetical protein GGR54DRAFT_405695 [Hypoxylon sp. NC1633]